MIKAVSDLKNFLMLLQVSPVKKMIVEDFNDDTYPDVLAAGNDYTYNLSTGYFDANKGVLLLNKGKMQDKDQIFI